MTTAAKNAGEEIFDDDTVSSPRSNASSTMTYESTFEKAENKIKYVFSTKSALIWKGTFAIVGVLIMFFARVNMPNNPIDSIDDKVLNYFSFLNEWIRQENHAILRRVLLFCCATQLDLIFFITFVHWVAKSNTSRLPITIATFYGIRAVVQMMWWSPYPEGYYWKSPGFPSFVAPYGYGTDFFFSGHSGFLIIMANEWRKIGNKKMVTWIYCALVYCIFILIVYQAHYSIDIFTGLFFSDWVFKKIDIRKDKIDNFWKKIGYTIEEYVGVKLSKKSQGENTSSSKKGN